MKQKAFSLIEIIFIISIISILLITVLPNFKSVKNTTDMVKIKSDIALIRNGLLEYKNKTILSNGTFELDTLEEDENYLFSKILAKPIISDSSSKPASWAKIDDQNYKVWLDTQTALVFTYDMDELSFDCDFSDDNCKELTQ